MKKSMRGTPMPFDPGSRGATGAGNPTYGGKSKPMPKKTGGASKKPGSKRSK